MMIIRDAMLGAKRFGEFQKSLGIAKNILSMRLRDLVADGILKAETPPGGGAHQEYVLTDKGRAVFPIMVALRQWAEEFAFQPGESTNVMVDRQNGQPIRKLELHAADGRLLGPADVTLRPATA